ncbi:MAG: hypothetical protein ACRDE5_16725 [Ginsengibacter sp.]
MIKYITLLVLVFLCFDLRAYSQSKDSIIRVYNNKMIYHFGNKYRKGNEVLSFRELGLEFTTLSTMDMYHKSKKLLNVSRVFNLASVGLIIVSVFTKTNIGGSIAFASGTGALGLGGIYFQTESSRYSERAIWERNRDVISGL